MYFSAIYNYSPDNLADIPIIGPSVIHVSIKKAFARCVFLL